MRRQHMRELTLEVIVGTFMFVALFGLCVFTIVLSRENFLRKSYMFEVVFDDIMGLREGDNVVMRGMNIGKVRSLALRTNGVLVAAALDQPVRLKTDYEVDIIFTSVLGGRYMQIREGAADANELTPGEPVRGRPPKDVMALASEVAADLKEITGKINRGDGTLGKLVNDAQLYNDARDIVDEIRVSLKERHLLANIEAAAANLNEITAKVNNGEGTLGLLVNDKALYLEAKQMISDVRATLDDLRETSPIVTFSSIFFGAF